MDDPIEFLTARYDEDEAGARAAHGRWSPTWSVDPEEWATGVGVQDGDGRSVAAVHGTYHADHIARHDPARVLADLAAKRKLLQLWRTIDVGVYSPDANQLADAMMQQLLAPYGKRAIWRQETGWQVDDLPAEDAGRADA